jgi:predicted RNA-binding protein with PIN domain
MKLMIDGHNLIGQTPGLRLDDPEDEAKLVMLLRSYAARRRGRALVVVFDHGVYGHPQRLDGYGVVCHFARSPQDADTQIARRLRGLARPREWALVTSDRALARVAEERGVRVIDSLAFAAQLTAPRKPRADAAEEKYDAHLSEAELDEWLRLFGEEP